MQAVKISCPVCNSEGEVEIENNLFMNSKSGILKIQVTNNSACGHSFLLHVDRNYAVRGYSKYDFIIDARHAQLPSNIAPEIKEPNLHIECGWVPRLTVPEENLTVYFALVLDDGAHILERNLLKTIFQMKHATTEQLVQMLFPLGEAMSVRITEHFIEQLCQKYEKRNLISFSGNGV